MYKVYRKEFGKKVSLCSYASEDKEQFISIAKNPDYEIHLDGKNVTNKYRPKKKKEETDE